VGSAGKAVDQPQRRRRLFVPRSATRTSFQVLFDAQSSIRNGRVPTNSPGIVDVERFTNETAAWAYVRQTITAEAGPVQYIAQQNKHVSNINDLV
jgi:hypothetical protein